MKTLILPFWCAFATAYQRPSGKWVVKLTANTQGIGCGGREVKQIIISNPIISDRDSAIRWAMSTPNGRKVQIVARGCHYLAQIKSKYSPEQRRELFSTLGSELRARYDGVNYLYESEQAQEEVRRIFKLSGMIVQNFPAGLSVV